MSRRSRSALLLLSVATAALDLWSKGLFDYPEAGDPPRVERVVFDGWLAWKPVYNPGGVWSLKLPSSLLLAATIAAVPLLLLWILAPKSAGRLESAAKALVLGGAAGNLYDRLRFGQVRDFIEVYFGDLEGWHWPTFNIADAALVAGIALLFLSSFRGRRSHPA